MVYNVIYDLLRRVINNIKYMPNKHSKEFVEAITEINLRRTKIVCVILLILNAFLIFIDLKYYKLSWDTAGGYGKLFRAHAAAFAFLIFYLFFAKFKNRTLKIKKLQYQVFIYTMLLWSASLTINSQYIGGQASAYIIASFCLACGYLVSEYERFIIFLSTYIYTVVRIILIGQNTNLLMYNLINFTFVFILSCFVSKVNYDQYIKIFKDQKIILKQTEELEKSKNNLEQIVKVRTNELFKANELLMGEINARQEIELESFKARLLYEEKARQLDETRENEKVRSDFFADISHELRTPINIIYSALQMMEFIIRSEKDEVSSAKTKKYMRIIKQNCFRLIRLVGNLIDITKIDARHFQLNLRNCDIIKTVENVTLSVIDYIESRKITLVFDTEVEEKIIACDPDMIERIILNLLSNAVKFTPEKGSIYVNIFNKPEKVVISVKDTGIGIPEAKQSTIFERFMQANGALNAAAHGSGIGLSLVRALVELHQGSIRLISECNKGSEFIIELPDISLNEGSKELAASKFNSADNIDRINIEFSDIYS